MRDESVNCRWASNKESWGETRGRKFFQEKRVRCTWSQKQSRDDTSLTYASRLQEVPATRLPRETKDAVWKCERSNYGPCNIVPIFESLSFIRTMLTYMYLHGDWPKKAVFKNCRPFQTAFGDTWILCLVGQSLYLPLFRTAFNISRVRRSVYVQYLKNDYP